jgi:hypothetical protein
MLKETDIFRVEDTLPKSDSMSTPWEEGMVK